MIHKCFLCFSHRNPVVRSATARFLVQIVYKMGPGRVLSGIKDITDRILPCAANFILDASPDTRYATISSHTPSMMMFQAFILLILFSCFFLQLLGDADLPLFNVSRWFRPDAQEVPLTQLTPQHPRQARTAPTQGLERASNRVWICAKPTLWFRIASELLESPLGFHHVSSFDFISNFFYFHEMLWTICDVKSDAYFSQNALKRTATTVEARTTKNSAFRRK